MCDIYSMTKSRMDPNYRSIGLLQVTSIAVSESDNDQVQSVSQNL